MSPQQGRKIAMVGATGTIGSVTLAALLKTNIHTITAITRTESSATFPSGVTVKKGDYSDASFLASALEGQDVLILQVNMMPNAMESQVTLIEAAAKAGVPWVLPTEFGSDIYSPIARDFPMTGMKKKYRDLIEEKGLSWIGIVNNPWFDWSMKQGLWSIDIPGRKATIYDSGDVKFNTATLGQVGRGVAALLSLPDDKLDAYKNKPVYLRSFLITQREVLDSAIRAMGTKESDWEILKQEPEVAIKASRDAVAAGNPFAFVGEFYLAHMQEGRGGNYEEKAAKDAEVLGLKGESLDEVIKRVVEELGAGSK
ncbi:NAD(P)-binding protein [Ophiobolus disseminans]|uniref:NAD(P)-binding protein n=1 Tax=Ophiobolus disseminans TaxID=1469910 RepID=A0A6A7A1Z5_9PLEO|nr:NAD(P)-binding protein [Ophiobolus disseminans]